MHGQRRTISAGKCHFLDSFPPEPGMLGITRESAKSHREVLVDLGGNPGSAIPIAVDIAQYDAVERLGRIRRVIDHRITERTLARRELSADPEADVVIALLEPKMRAILRGVARHSSGRRLDCNRFSSCNVTFLDGDVLIIKD